MNFIKPTGGSWQMSVCVLGIKEPAVQTKKTHRTEIGRQEPIIFIIFNKVCCSFFFHYLINNLGDKGSMTNRPYS